MRPPVLNAKALRAAIAAMVTALLLSGCVDVGQSGDHSRPESLPAEAFFVGGADGGVYVQLNAARERAESIYTGTIFYADGQTWYEGAFRLEPAKANAIDTSNKTLFDAWDGEVLYLRDRRRLRALDAPQ